MAKCVSLLFCIMKSYQVYSFTYIVLHIASIWIYIQLLWLLKTNNNNNNNLEKVRQRQREMDRTSIFRAAVVCYWLKLIPLIEERVMTCFFHMVWSITQIPSMVVNRNPGKHQRGLRHALHVRFKALYHIHHFLFDLHFCASHAAAPHNICAWNQGSRWMSKAELAAFLIHRPFRVTIAISKSAI